jgi:hypothetical protein
MGTGGRAGTGGDTGTGGAGTGGAGTGGAGTGGAGTGGAGTGGAGTGGDGTGGATGSGGTGGFTGTLTLTAILNGANERPTAVPTEGSGTATVMLNVASGDVTLTGSFTGLSSAATVAHIHGPANAQQTADPIGSVPLSVTLGTSGTVSGTGNLSVQLRASMLIGETYVNIHTGSFGAGEIRGQLTIPQM